MHRLLVTDLSNGQIQFAWQRDNAVPRTCQPTPFADPLTDADRAELRWYLEQFLGFPYGAERDRAATVELKPDAVLCHPFVTSGQALRSRRI